MDFDKVIYTQPGEKPLDRLVTGYSFTSIFRTMGFVGDSLSSGEFEARDKNNNNAYFDWYDFSWGQFLARQNGLVGYNFSRGGMMARTYIDSWGEENDVWNPEKACRAYVIALGANDILNTEYEIGSIDDIDENDYHNNRRTFIGEYAYIVSRYKEIQPDAKFFFVTFPKGEFLGDGKRAELKKKMNNEIARLAEYFDNAYLIDLYTYGPVCDKKFMDEYFLYGHMTPAGYVLAAQLIDSYIDYIVRTNPDEFRRVGFIGKGLDDFH